MGIRVSQNSVSGGLSSQVPRFAPMYGVSTLVILDVHSGHDQGAAMQFSTCGLLPTNYAVGGTRLNVQI